MTFRKMIHKDLRAQIKFSIIQHKNKSFWQILPFPDLESRTGIPSYFENDPQNFNLESVEERLPMPDSETRREFNDLKEKVLHTATEPH